MPHLSGRSGQVFVVSISTALSLTLCFLAARTPLPAIEPPIESTATNEFLSSKPCVQAVFVHGVLNVDETGFVHATQELNKALREAGSKHVDIRGAKDPINFCEGALPVFWGDIPSSSIGKLDHQKVHIGGLYLDNNNSGAVAKN
jgi:hypothetical protein